MHPVRMRPPELDEQIEKIIDETSGKKIDVIVQVGEAPEGNAEVLQAVVRSLKARRLVMSPRELLPAQKEVLEKAVNATNSRSAARSLTASAASMSSGISRLMNVLEQIQPWRDSALLDGIREIVNLTSVRTEPAPISIASSVAFTLTRDQLAKLRGADQVKNVFINRTIPMPTVTKSDSDVSSMKEKHGSAWGIEKINALAAREVFGRRGEGIKVAILDTGIDSSHPDLLGKVIKGVEIGSDGSYQNETEGSSVDTDRHGTHCAGVVVGGFTSGRWIGVAPEAKLLSATVLPKGTGSDLQVLKGMEWALQNGADILSLSLGGLNLEPQVLDTYTLAIINALRIGVPVVVAVGNDGHQTTGTPGDHGFALTVGATNRDDVVAGFSGGKTHIIEQSRWMPGEELPWVYMKPDVTAPGVDVFSCVPGGKHEAWNGTSMATPHVAGALALLLSGTEMGEKRSFLRASLAQDYLTSTVEELGERGQDQRYGFGRIDVLRAMCYAKERGY